ncbi:PP2C family protein-serine/threonine phosphatase [Streptacidiphilus sp. PAMC 29251]
MALFDPARLLSSLVRLGQLVTFEDLPELVAVHADQAGLYQARLYVVDLQQDVLREVTGQGPDAGRGGEELRIDSTVAGRAFRAGLPLSLPQEGRLRYWVPIVQGIERLGLLRVDTDPGSGLGDGVELEDVAALLGLLLLAKRTDSDSYARLTRTRPMSVAAELQRGLLPAMTFANHRVVIAAAVEPAYESAGDAFDYALADDLVHLALFDAMGHDTAAGLTASLAVAACRNQRRLGADLAQTSAAIEALLIEQYARSRYTTALLADLDMHTGMLTWTTCGHPPPILIRGGRRSAPLTGTPSHPLGTALGLPVTVSSQQLEPGDRVLLYTDGITEARDRDGTAFGEERFADFIVRHQADDRPVPETLRRLIHAVMDHHDGRLQDDATVLLCEWRGNQNPTDPVAAPI